MYFISILLLLGSMVHAQQTLVIRGKVQDYNGSGKLFLGTGNIYVNPVLDEEGNFEVTTHSPAIPTPIQFYNVTPKGKIINSTPLIWVTQDTVALELHWPSKSFTVSHPLPEQALSQQLEGLQSKERYALLQQNAHTWPALYFTDIEKGNLPLEKLQSLIEQIPQAHRSAYFAQSILSYAESKKRVPVKIGKPVEDFTLPNSDGDMVHVLKAAPEKPTVIGVFSSGCSYSIASIDLMRQFEAKNEGRVHLVTVWNDPTPLSWQTTFAEKKAAITWTNLLDQHNFAYNYLGAKGWPYYFVIDKNGMLTDIFTGYSKRTAKRLRALLQ